MVERLIDYERRQKPDATWLACLQNAISRWERENQGTHDSESKKRRPIRPPLFSKQILS
jgi:hypothetical protein